MSVSLSKPVSLVKRPRPAAQPVDPYGLRRMIGRFDAVAWRADWLALAR